MLGIVTAILRYNYNYTTYTTIILPVLQLYYIYYNSTTITCTQNYKYEGFVVMTIYPSIV